MREGNLQTNRHIRRNAKNIIIYNQISGMDDIAAANPGLLFIDISSLFPYIDVSATVSYLALSGNPEII